MTPGKAFFGARTGSGSPSRFTALGPEPTSQVRVASAPTGEVRRSELPAAQAGAGRTSSSWDGLTAARQGGSRRAATGCWSARSPHGSPSAGGPTLYGHRYPVRGPHGVPRRGRRVRRRRATAAASTRASTSSPLRHAAGGGSGRDGGPARFNGRLDGNYIVIRGSRRTSTYRYSHLPTASPLRRGRAGVHRPGRRPRRQDRQRPLGRLPPPLRDPPRTAASSTPSRSCAPGTATARPFTRPIKGRSPRPRRVVERVRPVPVVP